MRISDLKLILTTSIGLWIILILFSSDANATQELDCNKHPIYCQIKKNSPDLPSEEAFELSNVIYKAASKHNIPVRIFVGILAQESGYQLEAKGCHSGLVKVVDKISETDLIEPVFKHEEVKICSDFGIGQIYFKTARGFGFDIQLLTTDLEYSIEASAKVLADFQKRYSAKEVDWWTRYNARSKIKRKIYKQLVERYL